jgi:hypothetical protein
LGSQDVYIELERNITLTGQGNYGSNMSASSPASASLAPHKFLPFHFADYSTHGTLLLQWHLSKLGIWLRASWGYGYAQVGDMATRKLGIWLRASWGYGYAQVGDMATGGSSCWNALQHCQLTGLAYRKALFLLD